MVCPHDRRRPQRHRGLSAHGASKGMMGVNGARPASGQSRRFDDAPTTSDLPYGLTSSDPADLAVSCQLPTSPLAAYSSRVAQEIAAEYWVIDTRPTAFCARRRNIELELN